MKNVEIIRKIDDLGRVVIPKEIRMTLNLSAGDELSITRDNDKIILQKKKVIDWEYIGDLLNNSLLVDVPFALYDTDFGLQYRTDNMFAEDGSVIEADFIRTIKNKGYIAFCDDDYSQSSQIVKLIEQLT